jgi:hypothetical protein
MAIATGTEHMTRFGRTLRPDGDASVLPRGHETPTIERQRRIHGAVMDPEHGHGFAALERPQDRRTVEASGNRDPAIGSDREGADRAAMSAQCLLGEGRGRGAEP